MNSMKVIVTAPKGKMGRLIIKVAVERDKIDVSAALGHRGGSYIGEDAGMAAGLGYQIGCPVVDKLDAVIDDCDAIIDFSTVELSMEVMRVAVKHKKPWICGTTGFSGDDLREIRAASKEIPVLKAANTSYLVNLMMDLVATAADALEGKADIDIIDMHDRQKKDAPSGTAIELAEAMAKAMRQKNDLDFAHFHSIRSGDISSSHTVIFGCLDERLEITHHSQNWECFARGATDAAFYLKGKAPGFYTMQDVVRAKIVED